MKFPEAKWLGAGAGCVLAAAVITGSMHLAKHHLPATAAKGRDHAAPSRLEPGNELRPRRPDSPKAGMTPEQARVRLAEVREMLDPSARHAASREVIAALRAKGQRERMETAADFYAKGLLTPEVMVEVLKEGNFMDTPSRIDAMQGIPDLGDGLNALQVYRRSLMADWVRTDPQAALAAARAGPQPLMDLSNTFSSWAKVDATAAADWYAAHAASLTPEQRDAAAMGGFAVSLDLGDYDAAREWVRQISKPGSRDASLKFLAEQERRGR